MTRQARPGRMVSATEARRILSAQSVPPRRDAEAERELGLGGEAYHLEDGTFLVRIAQGGGALYRSYEAYRAVSREAEEAARRGPTDPVAELLPPAPDLIADVARLAAGLADVIHAPEPLDGSVESVAIVERAVAALPRRRQLSKELVSALVAYVGEALRQKVNGRWEVRQTGNGGATGEPVVLEPDGTLHQPFGVVFGELKRGRRGSLYGALVGELAAKTLGGRPAPPRR